MNFGKTINNQVSKNAMFLVFFRVSVAIFVLVHLMAFYKDLPYLFGDMALLPNPISDLFVFDTILTHFRLSESLGFPMDVYLNSITLIFLLFTLLLAMGCITQFSALVLLILHIALLKTNVFFNYGVDYFTNISLFFLCFLPSNLYGSLDAILFKRMVLKLRPKVDFQLLRRLFGIFICIAYFFSGFDKLLGYNWRNGEAIWKTITLPYFNLDFNLGVEWLSEHQWLLALIGWSVILVEMLYFLINVKALRKYWLATTIGMHLGIALLLNLYFFSTLMIILNLTAYYDFSVNKSYNFHYVKLLNEKYASLLRIR
mgnify:CR=1 FL=1|tara:strand:- start:22824 stop:23765 length:942 start_codon:yes stop_codon:yes gene_type:complete